MSFSNLPESLIKRFSRLPARFSEEQFEDESHEEDVDLEETEDEISEDETPTISDEEFIVDDDEEETDEEELEYSEEEEEKDARLLEEFKKVRTAKKMEKFNIWKKALLSSNEKDQLTPPNSRKSSIDVSVTTTQDGTNN